MIRAGYGGDEESADCVGYRDWWVRGILRRRGVLGGNVRNILLFIILCLHRWAGYVILCIVNWGFSLFRRIDKWNGYYFWRFGFGY